jgi:hypothetical protein
VIRECCRQSYAGTLTAPQELHDFALPSLAAPHLGHELPWVSTGVVLVYIMFAAVVRADGI